MENFGSVDFWFRSPQNHRYFYGKIWLGDFLASNTAKPAILFGRQFEFCFFLGTFQAADLRFQALQKHFFILM